MALAVTHVILTIVILDIFRHYVFGKEKFPRYLLVIGGIAGLAPDLDIPLSWIYSLISGIGAYYHGVFTHSIFWPIVFLVVGVILQQINKTKQKLKRSKKNTFNYMKWSKISYVISAGWFMHLIFDCLYGGYNSMLWPIHTLTTFCPEFGLSSYAISIDAIILVLWLIHEELHQKIKDYF
ncbi:MAG: metal-dependent hydrolase [Candidatus Woesearchaeota archaeon]